MKISYRKNTAGIRTGNNLMIVLITILSLILISKVSRCQTLINKFPSPSSTVYAIAADGRTVYLGGYFWQVGDSSRNHLAAINVSTGQVTGWNPNPDDNVWTIFISGSTIYVGGNFTQIGDSTRNHIAAIDAATGQVTSWNPNATISNPVATCFVSSVIVSGSNVYVGGNFTQIGDSARNNIAAVNTSTGKSAKWNPNANGFINTLAVSGFKIYAGGVFSNIGGQSRTYLASIDASTGKANAWDPEPNGTINTIASAGGLTMYVGGDFTKIGSAARNCLAAFNGSGSLMDWDPHANAQVRYLAVSGSTVYVAGYFDNIGGANRNRLASIDASGTATSWNPNANGDVYVVSVDFINHLVYAGGPFTGIDNTGTSFFAAFNNPDDQMSVKQYPAAPAKYILEQNYPNPFNPVTKIRYSIPYVGTHRDASVRINVYDILGRKIATLVNKKQRPGNYVVTFDGSRLPSGIYFYSLTAGNFHQTKKLIILK